MLPLFLTEFASLHIESQYFYLNHPPPHRNTVFRIAILRILS